MAYKANLHRTWADKVNMGEEKEKEGKEEKRNPELKREETTE